MFCHHYHGTHSLGSSLSPQSGLLHTVGLRTLQVTHAVQSPELGPCHPQGRSSESHHCSWAPAVYFLGEMLRFYQSSYRREGTVFFLNFQEGKGRRTEITAQSDLSG